MKQYARIYGVLSWDFTANLDDIIFIQKGGL